VGQTWGQVKIKNLTTNRSPLRIAIWAARRATLSQALKGFLGAIFMYGYVGGADKNEGRVFDSPRWSIN
jgi:hypothetical protein